MPRQQQSPYPAPSTTLAPQRSPHSPRPARSPSNAFTKGEHCQEVFFPSCTKPRWGGRCCYCAFFSYVLKPQRNFHRAAVSPAWREGHAGEMGRLKSDFVTATVQPNFSCQGCLGGMCRRLCPLPRHVPGDVSACVCMGVRGCARVSSHGRVCAFPRLCSGACPDSLALAGPSAHVFFGQVRLVCSQAWAGVRRAEGWAESVPGALQGSLGCPQVSRDPAGQSAPRWHSLAETGRTRAPELPSQQGSVCTETAPKPGVSQCLNPPNRAAEPDGPALTHCLSLSCSCPQLGRREPGVGDKTPALPWKWGLGESPARGSVVPPRAGPPGGQEGIKAAAFTPTGRPQRNGEHSPAPPIPHPGTSAPIPLQQQA